MAGRFALPYYPGLDGLRAVAVAGVLAFHSGFDWARGGHLGVSTFFTLSGFLITLLLIVERERTGRIALPAFWARRFRRLMPAALMGLGGIALFSALVADPGQLQRIRGEGLAACGYAVNWWFILTEKTYADLFASPSPVQHYWSLSIEEQFYAVFPALVAAVLAVGRGSRRVLAVIIAALALSSTVWMAVLHDPHRDPSRVYYGTDTRAAELLVGALLALWMFRGGRLRTAESSRSTAIIGMIAFPAMLVPWGLATTYTPRLLEGGYALYSIATAFVVAAAVRPGPLRSLLALRPLREIGRISYGVYLYHWPIYLWLSPERTGLDALHLFVLRVGVTLAVSEASYRWIEKPVRYGSRLTGARAWSLSGAGVAGVVTALTLVTADAPEPTISFEAAPPGTTRVARSSDGEPPHVLVVGDSVAFNVGGGLTSWADRTGRAVVKNTWISALGWCSVGRGGEYVLFDGTREIHSADCDAWDKRWGWAIQNFRPEVVIMLTGFWDVLDRHLPAWEDIRHLGDPEYDAWILDEFVAAVDSLSSRGAHVVWLTVPCVGPSPWGSPVRKMLDDPSVASDRIRHMNDVIVPRLVRRRPHAVTILDLHAKVCPDGRFTHVVDGVDGIRPDGLHFSEGGSKWLAEWLGPQVTAIAERTRLSRDGRLRGNADMSWSFVRGTVPPAR